MESMVSKERSRKARRRQKQAGRNSGNAVALRDHIGIGVFVALLAWGLIAFFMPLPLPIASLNDTSVVLPIASHAVFALASMLVTALFLNAVTPNLLRRNSRIILITIIVLLSVSAGKTILYLSSSIESFTPDIAVFMLPFILAPLLGALLLGPLAGMATGLVVSLFFAVYTQRSLDVLLTGLIATAAICHTALNVRTRSRVIRIAVGGGILQILGVLGVTLLTWEQTSSGLVAYQALACIGGALLAAIIALLVLPAFEHVFGITSDITLLEFSDLGHPLLQRLALEAPGTYHHSLVVANIAQAAAETIGANTLEARVASYFHDIGKLTKPNFFAENIHLKENPHDNLAPSMSTLIITSHVKEGLSLAMLHKLPEPVLRSIREHHGTSMLQYFHHKAMLQLELEIGGPGTPSGRFDEHNFRYPGPRPSTRVSAIVCLADSVEAASRSLEKPTPGHIENLVNDIVCKRLNDGQLDECELSLMDLSKIRKAFIFTLTTMLHGRIAYPKDEPTDQ